MPFKFVIILSLYFQSITSYSQKSGKSLNILNSYDSFFNQYHKFPDVEKDRFIKAIDSEIISQERFRKISGKNLKNAKYQQKKSKLLRKLDSVLSECMSKDDDDDPFYKLKIKDRILSGAASVDVSKCNQKFFTELNSFVSQVGDIANEVKEGEKNYKLRKKIGIQSLKEAELMSDIAVFKLDYKYLGVSDRFCNHKKLKAALSKDPDFKNICKKGKYQKFKDDEYGEFAEDLNYKMIRLNNLKKDTLDTFVRVREIGTGYYIGDSLDKGSILSRHNKKKVRSDLIKNTKLEYKDYYDQYYKLFTNEISDLLLTDHMQAIIGKRPDLEDAEIIKSYKKDGYVDYSFEFDEHNPISVEDIKAAAMEARVAILKRKNTIKKELEKLKAAKIPKKHGHQHRKKIIDDPLKKMFLEDPYSLGRAIMKNPKSVFEICKLQKEIVKDKDIEEKLEKAKTAAILSTLVVMFTIPIMWKGIPLATSTLLSGAATGITAAKAYSYIQSAHKYQTVVDDQNAPLQYDRVYKKRVADGFTELHRKLEDKAYKSAFWVSLGLGPGAIELGAAFKLTSHLSYGQAQKLLAGIDDANKVLDRYKILKNKTNRTTEETLDLAHIEKKLHEQLHHKLKTPENIAQKSDGLHYYEQVFSAFTKVYPGLKTRSLAADDLKAETVFVYE